MGLFSTGKRRKHKRFDYEPRYYNPEKEDDLKYRMRIKRKSRHKRRDASGLIYLSLLLAFAAYLYYLL
ncbi:MAG: hypothetical protein GVY12_16280 [Bacteroidetes bacterium]|jgi:hypothetical protein|nr:hypothetical protein [Bacteroidota bacterium]